MIANTTKQIVYISFPFLNNKSNTLISRLCAFWLLCTHLMAQNQSEAFLFEGNYTLDLASNIKGGTEQGYAYLGNLDLNFTFDTEKLGLWEVGQFFFYLLNNHGNALSPLIGDF